MPANKKTRKAIDNLCNEVIEFLSELEINDKNKNKTIDKIIIKAKNAKQNINKGTENKHQLNGYNRFLIDFNKIKNNEIPSDIINEKEKESIIKYINSNKDISLFKLVGKYWKEELNISIKTKYNLNDGNIEKKITKKGRHNKK